MDLYLLLKTIHILAGATWFGGVVVVTAMTAVRHDTDSDFLTFVGRIMGSVHKVMSTASLITVLAGGILVWLGAWPFDAWLILALVGVVASFAVALGILGPRGGRAMALHAQGRTTEGAAMMRGVLWAARFDAVILFGVVSLMATKPAWSDLSVLTAIAVVLFALVLAILARRPAPAASLA